MYNRDMQFIIRKLVLVFVFAIVLVILIAISRGYHFSFSQKKISPTGILVAASYPDGAHVFVNGKLKGATNTNVPLEPGEYDVEIKQNGYTPWKKRLKIKGEWVVKANALLFPQNPSLAPVTTLGISKASVSGSGDRIVIISETNNPEKDGVYAFENVRNPLSRINPLKLLVLKSAFPAGVQLVQSTIEFSPDEAHMLMTLYTDEESTIVSHIYLVDTTKQTLQPFEVTGSVKTIAEAWDEERFILRKKEFATLKKPLSRVAQSSFDIIAFSPDERKILYTATASATIPQVITPPLVSTNQTPEERHIEPGFVYLYDKEEDKNFKLFRVGGSGSKSDFGSLESAKASLWWYPDSAHLVIKEKGRFSVIDYDGSNRRTVYSAPFAQYFFAISKDGKLFVLANFNTESGLLFDMYSVGLK